MAAILAVPEKPRSPHVLKAPSSCGRCDRRTPCVRVQPVASLPPSRRLSLPSPCVHVSPQQPSLRGPPPSAPPLAVSFSRSVYVPLSGCLSDPSDSCTERTQETFVSEARPPDHNLEMSELQEVQITDENALLQDPLKAAELAAKLLQVQEQKHSIETPYGMVTVTIQGSPKPKRPAIVTFHDVGMDHKLCYKTLFDNEDMYEIVKNFVVCHIDAPGQEDGAAVYPAGYQYPSLDQLAETIPCVLQYLNFPSIIGIGVGAGAYVLARYTLSHPNTVEGLVLLNIDPNAKGWMDWAAHKLTGLTSSIPEMILSHLFSTEELSGNSDVVRQYKAAILNSPILSNNHLYWNSYNSRRDLNLERGGDVTLKCPVMLVVGDQAPHEDAVVECNSKLDPTQTSFLKMADSGGQPQITQPGKLAEAFKYFVQGMGYIPHILDKKRSMGGILLHDSSVSLPHRLSVQRGESLTLSYPVTEQRVGGRTNRNIHGGDLLRSRDAGDM